MISSRIIYDSFLEISVLKIIRLIRKFVVCKKHLCQLLYHCQFFYNFEAKGRPYLIPKIHATHRFRRRINVVSGRSAPLGACDASHLKNVV